MTIYILTAFGIIFYLLFWIYLFGARLGILPQSESAYKTSLKIAIVSNIVIGVIWSGYAGSETQRWIGLCGFAVSTLLAYMHFPKIKILIGYSVRFDNNKQGNFLQFFSQDRKIETAEMKALQNMIALGQNPSEYKMSTRREINISITF